ncbi:ABC transporter permease [Paraburkholderia sp. MMS20-SJTR3]|uniref:ABC transporter permease n=1 Tax=Paraburkholderia sejongensis TaxID=2886946 RepID=A0ABS8K513_9BURK|nr:ABC transporter permease [Paraburkholderia sp. MMS20-SJTR3]MCC8396973.1 ABC transporter permease [Paraburkholderia sp. MMS20-SJTR3]
MRKEVFPLHRSLEIQLRVLHALFMREIITRYGRHNLGFAWLFAEPMLFTLGVTILWSLFHDIGAAHHISAIAYTLTGYSTVLVWRNTIGRCTLAILPNSALLFHRNVRVIDLFLARILLEVSGATLSMIVLLLIFIVAGAIPAPANILRMMAGWGLLVWYASATGLLIGGLCEYSELVERLWHPIAYFQLPVSGALVMASWLPTPIRNIVMLFPAPNCVELFRYGYFGDAVTPYYDVPYTAIICLVLTWLGLWVVRDISSKVEPQ